MIGIVKIAMRKDLPIVNIVLIVSTVINMNALTIQEYH
jgi:hypothetical protein